MRNVELFVIGDSNTDFWNGTGDIAAQDQIPGVRTCSISAATAYSLLRETSRTQARIITLDAIHQAVAQGFDGWLMLNFGANDCNSWIWRQVPRLTLQESVHSTLDRYVSFIHEVRAIYPKIAIFGPPAATKVRDVGTEAERNLAILLFTSMLEEQLSAFGIPVMSIARLMIAADGSSAADLLREDNIHASPLLLPYALYLVNTKLGLQLKLADDPIDMKESRIHDFSEITYRDVFERAWIQYSLPEGSQYISEIALWPQTFEELGTIEVLTSTNSIKFDGVTLHPPQDRLPPTQRIYMPLGCHAREILFSSSVRKIQDKEIEIYKYESHLSRFSQYSRDVLFALHDQIMQTEHTQVTAKAQPKQLETITS